MLASENVRQELLHEILSQPSAPFRERHVIAAIEARLASGEVPHFRDPVGNIVVGAESRLDYERLLASRTDEPLRIFIAHLDHPGFHGRAWREDGSLEVKWHGGSPLKHLEGAKLWLASREGWAGHASLKQATMLPSGSALDSAIVTPDAGLARRFPKADAIYGGFGFRSPWWQEGELIYTKAADDLVGAFAVTSVALDLFARQDTRPAKTQKTVTGRKPKRIPLTQTSNRKSKPFIGLLTRAEEVGFIGAIGHLELGWLKKARRPILGVSLETSRTLPGAEIGAGPVVRLGDKFTVFDSGSLRVFTALAEEALPRKHQRRIMDGGTCEASAFTAYGFPCVGISVPLGNYHNQSFQGGPDSRGPDGPAPEFVHLGDVEGLIALCHELLKQGLAWADPFGPRRKDFGKRLKEYRPLLKAGP